MGWRRVWRRADASRGYRCKLGRLMRLEAGKGTRALV